MFLTWDSELDSGLALGKSMQILAIKLMGEAGPPHVSFKVPVDNRKAIPRESIEVRFIVMTHSLTRH